MSRRIRIVGAVFALSLLTAACGDSYGGGSGGDDAPDSPANTSDSGADTGGGGGY